MDAAHSNNSKKLLTLDEAALRLGVSVEQLLLWYQNNILIPTISPSGQICYKEEQLDQFLTILRITQGIGITPEKLETLPVAPPPPSEDLTSFSIPNLTNEVLPQTVIPSPMVTSPSLPTKQHKMKSILQPSSRLSLSLVIIVALLGISVLTQQGLDSQSASKQTKNTTKTLAQAEKESSSLNFLEKGVPTPPVQLKKDASSTKYLRDEGETVMQEQLAASRGLFTATTDPTTDVSVLPTGESAPSSFASVGTDTENASPLDKNGNIRGKAEEIETLTAFRGTQFGTESTSLKPVTNSNMQLLLLIIGALAFTTVFWKQLAFVGTHPKKPLPIKEAVLPVNNLEKIMEVSQKTDGTVVLYFQEKEFRISKPELYSESDRFFERLMELSGPQTKELEYDIHTDEKMRLSTPLSRIVTRLGFVGVKRDLFFPRTSKDKLLFRRFVTREDIDAMGLTPTQILQDLIKIS